MFRERLIPVMLILTLGLRGLSAQGTSSAELDDLIAQLSGRAASAGFVDQLLSAARGRRNIHEALNILTTLTPKAQAALRKPLLREQAMLLEFLERWLDAAALWQEAAATPLGAGDADSLVAAGLAFLLGGDNARAEAVASAAKSISTDAAILDKARLVMGWARLASGDGAAAYAEAYAVLQAGRKDTRLAAFDLALAASGAEDAASLLRSRKAEYPLMGDALPHPRYAILSLAGNAQLWVSEEEPKSAPGSSAAGAVSSTQPKASDEAARPTRYQVGAFKDPANAEAARKRLSDKGLAVSIVTKKQGADTVSVVYVAAGVDPARTLIGIKDAGFEA
ncbi:MAG TPA: hypothetical protein DCG47_08245, partial [Spirochaetaceae bacterium]|nr:hypothetical protein [Spirochaetaceae bacterium]